MKTRKLMNLAMFDLMKGIGIILVLIRHSIWWKPEHAMVWQFIYSVLMPVFFVTSGFFLKKKPIKAGLTMSCRYLFYPYGCTMGFILLVGLIHRGLSGRWKEWADVFLIPTLLVDSKHGRLGPMWFVFTLFLCWCIFYIVVNLIEREAMQSIAAIFLCILGGVLLPMELPFQAGQAFLAYGLVYGGVLIREHKLFERKIHWMMYLGMAALWIASACAGLVDFGMYDIKYGAFAILGSLFGSFLVIKVFLYLNLITENPVCDGIRVIGRNSMSVLCIHAVEHAIFPWSILFPFTDQNRMTGAMLWFFLRSVLIFLIGMAANTIRKYRLSKKLAGGMRI